MYTRRNIKPNVQSQCPLVLLYVCALLGTSSSYAAGGAENFNLPDLPDLPDLPGAQDAALVAAPVRPVMSVQPGQGGASQSGNPADPWNNGTVQSTGPAVPPPATLRLGDNASAAFGPSSTGLQYQSASSLAEINAGIGYMKPDSPSHTTSNAPLVVTARAGTLLGTNFALGANLSLARAWSELVLNSAYRLPNNPFFLSLSGGYALGTQNFDFSGVPLDVKLGQASYVLGGTYVVPSESALGLQSVSLMRWGAQASQRTDTIAGPTSSTVETDTAYVFTTNNYRLSLGHLLGASIGSQYAIASNLVVKGSLGVETVTYPFSDGTVTNNQALYRSAEALYEPPSFGGVVLGAQYKRGVAENRAGLSATYNGLSLTAYVSAGVNGTQGNRGVMLSYTIPLGGPAAKSAGTSLAERLRPASLDNPVGLLTAVATRPLEMPLMFLAKVDTTANGRISVNKQCAGSDVSVSSEATATVPIGPGPLLIKNVTRDSGSGPVSFPYGSAFTISGDTLLMTLLKFPAPVAQDNYVATLTDAQGASYTVYVTTSQGSGTACAK